MSTCTKRGCQNRTFMDSDRCFDHQMSGGFKAWFILCALVGLVFAGVGIWAVIQLVLWVTAR